MQYLRYKLEEFVKNLAWHLIYLLWIILCPLKFKPFPKNPKSILIIERLFLGDLIAATPTIRAVKQRYPNAKLSVLVHPKMKDVLLGNPNVNEIITDVKKSYDLAIILHPGLDWGSFKASLKIIKSKFRMGSTKVGLREGKGYFLHRKTFPTFKLKHKIDDNLDVIKPIKPKSRTLELHTQIKPKYKNTIIIHATPQHESHKWDEVKFAQLADKLKGKIVFTGAEKDKSYNEKIISLMKSKAINLAGKTSIQELFALVKDSKQVISVDTGIMHIAAAFNKPSIALFGAGNPKIWRPYSSKAKVIFKKNKCVSCMKHKCQLKGKRRNECMDAIQVEDVLTILPRI